MDEIITAERMAQLLGVTPKTVCELANRDVLVKGKRRGTYLMSSVARYCAHLRTVAAGRGSSAVVDARVKLAEGQADLATARAAKMRGELVEASEVETFWRGKLRAFRGRILAVPTRMRDLTARQSVTLSTELRACLDELANDAG